MSVLWSHPDQTLDTHIGGVLEVALTCVEGRTFSGWNATRLRELTAVAAVFHDFAKATSYFQSYILSSQKKKTRLSSHTALSSIVSYYVGKHVLEGSGDDVLPDTLFLLMAVRRHHGNMSGFLSEINAFYDQEELLIQQAEAVDYDGWNRIVADLLPRLSIRIKDLLPFTAERVRFWVTDFQRERRYLRRWIRKRYENGRNQEVADYFKYNTFYSILLDADKNQAALRERIRLGRREIKAELVEQYRRERRWASSPFNQLRERAYREVEQRIDRAEGRLFSINLPTGMGKTLIALNTALRLRRRRQTETGILPRLIYALPFLSVIDQNHEVFRQVLSRGGAVVDHSVLMKHHSLVEPNYKSTEDEEFQYDSNAAQILLEGWNSEIVCTTFVQLFQSLLSNRNRVIRKFHRFSHAIILIDEVQGIPVKYWPLMREMLLELTEGMNTDVILLTATEPRIFESFDPVIPLCDHRCYFESLNRITLFPRMSQKMTVEAFVQTLPLQREKTHLFILNTIASAKELYRQLSERIQEPIGFLSTHLPPKERLQRIEAIKSGQYHYVVSTQLVEAGVDIDFDIVYRDLAPLDAINQSAGRCNRNGNRQGQMYIIHLWNGNTSYGRYVYEPVKLDVTRTLLEEHEQISEPMLLPLIESYFERVKITSNLSESSRILRGVHSLYFEGEDSEDRLPVSRFRLIEDDQGKVDVFIELDDEAAAIWREFEEIVGLGDALERYRRFAKLKKRFQEHVVSIPKTIENRPPLLHDIFYVGKESLDEYYDAQTGFITEGVAAIW
jgi:CRISPR-associated endonuclease/helicase Cas3